MFQVFLIALVSGLLLNRLAITLDEKTSFFKLQQKKGVSKLGGIALVLTFFLSSCFLNPGNFFGTKENIFLIGLLLTFFLGLLDDICALSPFKKLFFQVLIALLIVSRGFHTQVIFFSTFINQLLSVFWFIVLMNAINFLDIVDGLAAGITVICSLTFLCISGLTHNMVTGIFSASLLGANLAFLVFNRAPAKLYMGDMGSLFNGCALAGISVLMHYAHPGREVAVLVPLLILALPIYDFIFVVVVRWRAKKSLMSKSRDHFILRLLDRGWVLKKAVHLMYFFTFLFNLAAVLLLKSSNGSGMVLFIFGIGIWLFFAAKIGRRRFS
jgi:UDP-GlcNAc:undecaprenyl-phosphate GlcNAc-1-phosphate transferase